MALVLCKICRANLKRCKLGIDMIRSSSALRIRNLTILANKNHVRQCRILSADRRIFHQRCYASKQGGQFSNSKGSSNEKAVNEDIQVMMEESERSSFQLEKENLSFEGLSPQSIEKLTADRPRHQKIDPSLTSVFLFPGQGSQFVGMCKGYLKYPNVQEMFEVASDILQYDIKGLCINGPKEDLDQTIFCQPAVFLTSLAAVEKLKEENPKAIENCVAAAGFSVGEYAALVFAGAMSFEDAVLLIQVRAEAMQRASELVQTGMMSVVGRNEARYKYICKEASTYCQNHGIEGAICSIANYLYPDGRVLAGNVEALNFIQERAKDFSLRQTRRLPVSGAFHTSFMKPAEEKLRVALDKVTLETPLINVHSNVDGKVYRDSKHIKNLLRKQLTLPVKWEQTMHEIYERGKGVSFPHTYEVGPGNQLGTILKRINRKAFDTYWKVKE